MITDHNNNMYSKYNISVYNFTSNVLEYRQQINSKFLNYIQTQSYNITNNIGGTITEITTEYITEVNKNKYLRYQHYDPVINFKNIDYNLIPYSQACQKDYKIIYIYINDNHYRDLYISSIYINIIYKSYGSQIEYYKYQLVIPKITYY